MRCLWGVMVFNKTGICTPPCSLFVAVAPGGMRLPVGDTRGLLGQSSRSRFCIWKHRYLTGEFSVFEFQNRCKVLAHESQHTPHRIKDINFTSISRNQKPSTGLDSHEYIVQVTYTKVLILDLRIHRNLDIMKFNLRIFSYYGTQRLYNSTACLYYLIILDPIESQ